MGNTSSDIKVAVFTVILKKSNADISHVATFQSDLQRVLIKNGYDAIEYKAWILNYFTLKNPINSQSDLHPCMVCDY